MWVLIDPPAVEITRRDRVRTHKGGTAYLFVAPSHDIPKKKSEIQEIHVVITAAPFSSLQPRNSL